ncbi:MAG: GGDEF domain-containing protein [Pirellulales bacterium]
MFESTIFAQWDRWSFFAMALAVVAAVGYLVGRRGSYYSNPHVRKELERTREVARELERITRGVRKNIARHRATISRFEDTAGEPNGKWKAPEWKGLSREAEEVLKPSLRLASEIAQAYDEIRRQTDHLMSLSDVHTDPLTGVGNRRALDETLAAQFALMTRYDRHFALAIFDIDHFGKVNEERGPVEGDRFLQSLTKLLTAAARDTDIVTRYGGEEFAVVMPETGLEGASLFAERLRKAVENDLPATVSGGVTTAIDGDNPQTLLARAEAALGTAKTNGCNLVYENTGTDIRRVVEEASASTAAEHALSDGQMGS